MTTIKFSALPLEFEVSDRVSYGYLGEVFSIPLYNLRLDTKEYFTNSQRTFKDLLGYISDALLGIQDFMFGYPPTGLCRTRLQTTSEGRKGLKITTSLRKGNTDEGKTFVLGHEETHAAINAQRSNLVCPLIAKYSKKLLELYQNTTDREVKADIGGLTAVFLRFGLEGISEIERSTLAIEALKRYDIRYNPKLFDKTTLLDLIALTKQ